MKHSVKLTFILIFLLVFSFAVSAQNSDWKRITSDDGEFSIEVPANLAYFYDKDGFYYNDVMNGAFNLKEMQMLNASLEKTYMSVEIYRMTNPKSYLDALTERRNFAYSKIKTDQKDFTIRKGEFNRSFEQVRKRTENINFETLYISSKTHFYVVTVWNKGKSNPVSERFLSSIRLGTEQNDSSKINAVKISTLKPVTMGQIGGELSKKEIDALPENPKYENGTPGELFVLHIPNSGFNFANVNMRAKGVVKLKVTYSKEGRIDKIMLISGLPGGLNALAFFSILRTKFIPSEKDGEPVTIERVITYDYTSQF